MGQFEKRGGVLDFDSFENERARGEALEKKCESGIIFW
jgi:hypothetical protein